MIDVELQGIFTGWAVVFIGLLVAPVAIPAAVVLVVLGLVFLGVVFWAERLPSLKEDWAELVEEVKRGG